MCGPSLRSLPRGISSPWVEGLNKSNAHSFFLTFESTLVRTRVVPTWMGISCDPLPTNFRKVVFELEELLSVTKDVDRGNVY